MVKRTTQPLQEKETKVDWSNPITKDLKFFGSFHKGFPYDYVKQERGIPGSAWRGMDPVDGVMAMTINDLDGKNNAVTFPKHDEIYDGISECTIMCFTRNRSSTVSAGQRPYGHMGTGNDPFYMSVGNTGNLAVVLLTDVASYNSTGADYTTEGVDIDRWALWGATWKNDTLTGRWQNRKDSSPTTTSGVMATPDVNADNVPRVGFANVGGTNSWNGWVAFAAFWDRALSDAEWNSMVEHPWQIFKPKPQFSLTEVPEDNRLVTPPRVIRSNQQRLTAQPYQGRFGYTIDFGKDKLSPSPEGAFGVGGTVTEYGDWAVSGLETWDLGPYWLRCQTASGVPIWGLSPNKFKFGAWQFSEADVFVPVTEERASIWIGPAVFCASVDGGGAGRIDNVYAILVERAGGGTATYRLYRRRAGAWTQIYQRAGEIDCSDRPVRLRLEAHDTGSTTSLRWWLDGVEQTPYEDTGTARLTSASAHAGHSYVGLSWGSGSIASSALRWCTRLRAGCMPERSSVRDFIIIDEKLPDLTTFDKEATVTSMPVKEPPS